MTNIADHLTTAPSTDPTTMTTPMMQQYREAKERHPGMLLLFRMGDFYELFDDDAEVALRVARPDPDQPRQDHPDGRLPAPRPGTLPRASCCSAGHRVAVCDQVEDPAQAKGLVRREVTRVVTPGTLTEDDLLDPRRSNHLVAPCAAAGGKARRPGLGGPVHRAVPGRRRRRGHGWPTSWAGWRPAECLYAERPSRGRLAGRAAARAAAGTGRDAAARTGPSTRPRPAPPCCTTSASPPWPASASTTDQPCLAAAGALLLYLQETLKAEPGPSHAGCGRIGQDRFLFLDEVTRRSLELTRTLREGGRDGSLLSVLDRTVDADGGAAAAGVAASRRWPTAPPSRPGSTPSASCVDEHALRAGAARRPRARRSTCSG